MLRGGLEVCNHAHAAETGSLATFLGGYPIELSSMVLGLSAPSQIGLFSVSLCVTNLSPPRNVADQVEWWTAQSRPLGNFCREW